MSKIIFKVVQCQQNHIKGNVVNLFLTPIVHIVIMQGIKKQN